MTQWRIRGSSSTTIKAPYSKVVQITYTAHGFHRVAKNVRYHFPRIEELIAKAEQVFLKVLLRVLLFKTEVLGVTLPLEPIPLEYLD